MRWTGAAGARAATATGTPSTAKSRTSARSSRPSPAWSRRPLVRRAPGLRGGPSLRARLGYFEREAAGVPEDVLARVDWERQVGMADQTRREIAAVAAYHAPAESGIAAPTLCLVGEHSPAYLHETTRALADAIPDSRTEVLAGEGHLATLTGPAKLADAVGTFLAVS